MFPLNKVEQIEVIIGPSFKYINIVMFELYRSISAILINYFTGDLCNNVKRVRHMDTNYERNYK
jgi:hypothetical protein